MKQRNRVRKIVTVVAGLVFLVAAAVCFAGGYSWREVSGSYGATITLALLGWFAAWKAFPLPPPPEKADERERMLEANIGLPMATKGFIIVSSLAGAGLLGAFLFWSTKVLVWALCGVVVTSFVLIVRLGRQLGRRHGGAYWRWLQRRNWLRFGWLSLGVAYLGVMIIMVYDLPSFLTLLTRGAILPQVPQVTLDTSTWLRYRIPGSDLSLALPPESEKPQEYSTSGNTELQETGTVAGWWVRQTGVSGNPFYLSPYLTATPGDPQDIIKVSSHPAPFSRKAAITSQPWYWLDPWKVTVAGRQGYEVVYRLYPGCPIEHIVLPADSAGSRIVRISFSGCEGTGSGFLSSVFGQRLLSYRNAIVASVRVESTQIPLPDDNATSTDFLKSISIQAK